MMMRKTATRPGPTAIASPDRLEHRNTGIREGQLAMPEEHESGIGRNSETWTWILVGAGVFLRILEFADNRQLYRDEVDLLRNLVGFAFYDFWTPLSRWQLAPPGFLAVERIMILLPFRNALAARLVPFICSIGSMFLMRSVAQRYLTAAAVPIAVGLFALSDWMLYYSVEIKQYSSDVMLTLAALYLAAAASAAAARRDFVQLAALGAVGVWFSHPLALVLAGIGSYFILRNALRSDWRQALAWAFISVLWAVNFGGCYLVSQRIVSKDGFLEAWWAFAYLPFPPRSLAELEQIFWQLINVVNSPSGVVTPLGVLPSAFIGAGFFLLGAWSLGRRWRGGLFVLVSPIFFALAASVLHRYPFHGRLLLFLIPSIHLLVAQGAAALGRIDGAKLTFVVGAFLLAQPVIDVLCHRAIRNRSHEEFDSHGDLHPDVLDYLEGREKTRKIHDAIQKAQSSRLDIGEPQAADGQSAKASR